MGYFQAHTAIQHHELALWMLHLILSVAEATSREDIPRLNGLCASGVVFLDQLMRDGGSMVMAREVALMRDPELPYKGPEDAEAKARRGRYDRAFSPLCPVATYAAVASAAADHLKLKEAAKDASSSGGGKKKKKGAGKDE